MVKNLSPSEAARAFGMERREVIELCMALGVPIFEGRIEQALFEQALESRREDVATWALMDATGNLIDSFTDGDQAWAALQRVRAAHASNAGHVALVGFDANGQPVGGRTPSPTASAERV
jgi:hypothetical protein